jgi:uncharacterized protein involved in exopolysaccharide biosynthesis
VTRSIPLIPYPPGKPTTLDANDRSDPHEHGSTPGDPFRHPDWVPGSDPDLGNTPAPRIGRGRIIRGLASQWWRILLVWLLVATPVAYLIYRFVDPTYEAASLLRAEPSAIDRYNPGQRGISSPGEVRPYLETQIRSLTSDRVLDAAIARPSISNLPMIRSSKDPKAAIRQELKVDIVGKNTHLIEVALSSRDPDEAAAIVNAVVDAYLDQHNRYQQATNQTLKLHLENELGKLRKQIQDKQDDLEKLVEKGNVSVARQIMVPKPVGKEKAEENESSFSTVTEDQYRDMSNRLIQADFELMDAQARIDTARLPKAQASADKIRELDSAVEEARRKRDRYRTYIARIEVRSISQSTEQLRAQKLNQELSYLRRLHEAVSQRLGQLEFEIGQEAYRISVQDKAAVPRAPADNKRLANMGGASVGLLLVIFGSFLVRELTARGPTARDATA